MYTGSSHRRFVPFVLLSAMACKPPEPAPENMEDLVVFSFEHFQDDEQLALTMEPALEWAALHEEEAREGWLVSDLREEHLTAVGIDEPNLENLVGALGIADYTSSLDDVLLGLTHLNKDTLYERTESFAVLEEDGDRTCFLGEGCSRYGFTTEETTKVPFLGRSTRTVATEFTWVNTSTQRCAAMRQVAPEPVAFHAAVPLMGIDQQYGLVILCPYESGVRRIEAFWVEARLLGSDLPEGIAVRTTVNQFQKAADDLDAWVSGE